MILARSTQHGESFGKNPERWDMVRAAGVAIEAQVFSVLFLCCSRAPLGGDFRQLQRRGFACVGEACFYFFRIILRFSSRTGFS